MSETMHPEYLTVRELADLLRIKERKVYDLAASGTVPCSRATGKLLFPAREVRAWIAQESSGGVTATQKPRPPILLGSHDPLLDWAIRQSRCGLATFFDGSMDGLNRFRAGEGVACGLHIHDAASGTWNVPAVTRACAGDNVVLVSLGRRRRGLVARPDGPNPTSISDLCGLRVAPRQPESGTHALFEHLVAGSGTDPGGMELTPVARTETDAVQCVARGDADVTFGLEAVARDFNLNFVPLVTERFDLLADRRAWFEPQMQTLLEFCTGPEFRERAEAMGGYDIDGLGDVRWNA